MKNRINSFLEKEKLSPTEFADKIGVQRSSVSHVLNGRNYPSASFITKILKTFTNVNPRWLMLGEGDMYQQSHSVASSRFYGGKQRSYAITENTASFIPDDGQEENKELQSKKGAIERIIVFYSDQSFTEYKSS